MLGLSSMALQRTLVAHLQLFGDSPAAQGGSKATAAANEFREKQVDVRASSSEPLAAILRGSFNPLRMHSASLVASPPRRNEKSGAASAARKTHYFRRKTPNCTCRAKVQALEVVFVELIVVEALIKPHGRRAREGARLNDFVLICDKLLAQTTTQAPEQNRKTDGEENILFAEEG